MVSDRDFNKALHQIKEAFAESRSELLALVQRVGDVEKELNSMKEVRDQLKEVKSSKKA